MLISDRAMENGLRPRIIVMLTSALVLLVLATSFFAGWEQRQRDQAEMDVRMRTLSLQRATILSRAIEDWRAQVRFLSQIPPMRGLVRADQTGIDPRENTDITIWRRRLEADLLGFAHSRPGVEWMALLSSRQNAPIMVVEGQGRIPPFNRHRDDRHPPVRDGAAPVPLPAIAGHKRHIDLDLLGALSTRQPGDIIVADMDLARDGDRIAEPARPLMRMAVAVPGVDGARFGALSLAVDARGLMADLTNDVLPIFTLYLLDAQENFLLHPDPARSFAFARGRPFRWSDQFQPLDGPPRAGGSSQFLGPDGPVHVIRQKVLLDRGDGGRYLTLVVTVPDRVVAATAETVQIWVAAIGLPLTVLLLLLMLVRRHDRQVMARDAWLGAIVSGAGDAIIGLSPDGRVTSWNAGATHLFGYGLADAMGMTTRSLIVPSDLSDEEQEMLARVGRGESVPPMHTHRRHRDGHRIAVSITAAPVRGTDGQGGAALIIRDIRDIRDIPDIPDIHDREQVAAGAGIRSLNARVDAQVRERTMEIEARADQCDAILNCAGSAIIACDQTGTITLYNPAAEAMLGYTPQEVVGKATPALFHDPAELSMRAEAVQSQTGTVLLSTLDVLAMGTKDADVDTREWSYINKEGDRLPVLLSVSILTDRAGITIGYLIIATDLSAQVRNAGQLRQALAEAEAAPRAHAAFMASLAQEIRTPLNAILSSARQVMGEPLGEEQHSHLDGIHRAARGLMSVFNDILDYSGIEAGVLVLDPAPFRLSDPILTVSDLHGPALAARGLALDVSIDPTLPDWVIGDAARIRQIVENLVASAVKFTQGGGTIGISLRHGAGGVTIIVSDTGTGMAAEQAARLFNPMALDRDNIRRPHGATAMGLALTHRLVLLMGGTIRAESTPGRGSRFIIDLVLDPTDPPAGTQPPPPSLPKDVAGDGNGLSGARILLVEDNELNRHMAKAMLDRAGAETIVASNGQEGVSAFQEGGFDLVLMDMHMPVMDGLAATRAIRALPTGSHLPILALTAAGRPEEMRACLAAGMDDHIDKPFVPALFLSTLRRWLAAEGTGPALTPVAPAAVQGLPILIDGIDGRIDGIDMEQAMGRVMGDRSLLAILLEQFASRFDGFADKVAARIAAADLAQATHKLHELRGAAGNISALAIADLAGTLEDALRTTPEADHTETLTALKGALTTLITAIHRRPPVPLVEAFGED